jgi:hypothetical protein
MHYRARSYDPQTGRFVQNDPPSQTYGTSRYKYSGNNPITYTDPLGLWAVKTTAKEKGHRFPGYGIAVAEVGDSLQSLAKLLALSDDYVKWAMRPHPDDEKRLIPMDHPGKEFLIQTGTPLYSGFEVAFPNTYLIVVGQAVPKEDYSWWSRIRMPSPWQMYRGAEKWRTWVGDNLQGASQILGSTESGVSASVALRHLRELGQSRKLRGLVLIGHGGTAGFITMEHGANEPSDLHGSDIVKVLSYKLSAAYINSCVSSEWPGWNRLVTPTGKALGAKGEVPPFAAASLTEIERPTE